MLNNFRHAAFSLRRWAGYFFQPCPHFARTIAGAVLAALVAACLLFVLHLGAYGWKRTIALLPQNLSDGFAALAETLTPLPPVTTIPPSAPWRLYAPEAPMSVVPSVVPPAPLTPSVPALSPPTPGQASPEFTPETVAPTVAQALSLFIQPVQPGSSVAPSSVDSVVRFRAGVDTFVRAPLRDDALPYSELPNASTAEVTKQVDYALTQTMSRLNLGWQAFQLISHERRQSALGHDSLGRLLPGMTGSYLLQRLRIYLPASTGHTAEGFTASLAEMLTIWSERATLHRVDTLRLRIQVDGAVTHELFLSPEARGAQPFFPPPPGTPVLTLVIDDMGASPEAAQRLLNLGIPVTLSVWPRAAHAARVADMAWRAGQEVLIHQPTEPLGFPAMQPGPGALFTRMSRMEIVDLFLDNVRRVPHAVGVNNHMGSRFTTNQAGSATLCAAAAEQGLFVLDSLTHPRSLLAQEAVRQGITTYRRAVFLDDPLSRDAVRAALREAEQIARRTGQAVAIGHPHAETLDVLQEWARTRDSGICIVPLRGQRPLF